MSNQVNSLKKGLTVKDLVTTGIFSAIFFVFTLIGGLPFAPNPVLTFYMPMGAALLCGPVYLLMVAKVQKRWSVTILGIFICLPPIPCPMCIIQIGSSAGITIFRTLCQRFAPSRAAASISSPLIFAMVVDWMMEPQPIPIQIFIRAYMIQKTGICESASQFCTGSPNSLLSTSVTAPSLSTNCCTRLQTTTVEIKFGM